MLAEEALTKWPKVIGVVSLIYAIGGMLCQVGAGAMTFLGGWLASLGGFKLDLPLSVKLIGAGLAVLTFCVGLLMLVGAVHLLRRRRAGPSLLKKWVVLRLVLILLGIVATIANAPAQVQIQRSMIEYQNDMLRQAGRTDRIVEKTDEELWQSAIRQAIIASGVFAVYPVFLGVWLSRKKITAEVQRWD